MDGRRRILTIRWLVYFLVLFPALAVALHGPVWWRVLRAAAFASILPTASLAFALVLLRKRDRTPPPRGYGDERSAVWRTYEGGRPRRWRGGVLHRSGAGAVFVPLTGAAGPRLDPATVRRVDEREATRREAQWSLFPVRVLEVTTDSGRVDVAVEEADVADIRGWLGHGPGGDRPVAR